MDLTNRRSRRARQGERGRKAIQHLIDSQRRALVRETAALGKRIEERLAAKRAEKFPEAGDSE